MSTTRDTFGLTLTSFLILNYYPCSRVRLRQLHHRTFAAVPGHPALKQIWHRIMDNSNKAASMAGHPVLEALERSGPGVFTDTLLEFATANPPGRRDGKEWSIRFLPRSVFGVPEPTACSIVDANKHIDRDRRKWSSSWFWKHRGSNTIDWSSALDDDHPPASKLSDLVPNYVRHIEMRHSNRKQLYPVSAAFDPPFEIMTHLAGTGDSHAQSDVSAALTLHGMWQPSVQPTRKPSLIDAIVGSLGLRPGNGGILVDVGAGYGVLSLAAAARGHRVHAFELSTSSVDALQSAIARNGFGGLVQVHRVPLGSPAQQGPTCLALHSNATWARAATAAASAADISRGYSIPSAHAVDASACAKRVPRRIGASAISAEGEGHVGALRISANGWEGYVLEGFLPLIQRQQPPVIAIEWNPTAMLAAGYTNPLDVIYRLVALGYRDVSHAGFVCDERWYAVTYGVRRRGGMVPEEIAGLKQPTWCRLLAGEYHVLLDKADGKFPETLLFVNKEAGQASPANNDGDADSFHEQQTHQQQGAAAVLVDGGKETSAAAAVHAVKSLSAMGHVEALPDDDDSATE